MIMKNGKQIGFIYKNGKKIDKIIRHGKVYFEQGFTREKTSTTLPITFNSVGKNLKDYKIYGNASQNILPSEYTQLDYIKTNGNQYIDTGVYGNLNIEIEIKASRMTLDTANQLLFGSIGNNYSITINLGSANTTRFGTKSYSLKAYDYITADRPSIFICNKNGITIDGTLTGSFNETNDFTTETTLLLMTAQNGSTKLIGKIYYCKIYDNGVLIRNFIPCYRNSDEEAGLYDLINNIFYTNQGTDEFVYGNVAPTPEVPIEIVSCGDLITDSQDENYGKYKIPVNVNNVITNIYLDEPLRKTKTGNYTDYIDFANKKIYRKLGETGLTDFSVFTVNSVLTNYVQYATNAISNLKLSIVDSSLLYCNYIKTLGGTTSSSKIRINIRHEYLGTTSNSTTREAKQALINLMNGKTMKFVYPLEAPTEESITLPSIPTIDGNNTLNIETEITPSQVYIKYKSNN